MRPWEALEGLLVCPRSRRPLRRVGPDRLVSEDGAQYPLLDGVPVLRPGAVTRIDPGHESNAVPGEIEHYMRSRPGRVLFMGAGSTTFRADNVLELEFNLFRNTDVVADAHHLPLPEGAFRSVVALNLFEHLADPPRAAREIHRVLAPGGEVVIHTAFLQPLHEAPSHYYNATEFGLRRWFEGFSDVTVEVSPNFNPYYTLSWLAHELLAGARAALKRADRHLLEATTLRELAAGWQARTGPAGAVFEAFGRLPEGLQRQLAAGFQLVARKGAA